MGFNLSYKLQYVVHTYYILSKDKLIWNFELYMGLTLKEEFYVQ